MPSLSRRGLAVALVVAAVLCGLIAYSAPLGVDYFAPPCHPYICDDGAPAIDALAGGHVHSFFTNQPPMGAFSLLVRAPFAAVAKAVSPTELLSYRLGALARLLAPAVPAGTLMASRSGERRVGEEGRSRWAP